MTMRPRQSSNPRCGLISAVTASTALAAQDPADAGAVLRSDNGGRSWNQIAELPGVITQLDFWSATDGVAATYQPGTSSPWQLWASSDGGSSWLPYGPLPGGDTDIYGPWMSASGHGLLLTVTGGSPWETGSGGLPPVRIWTTSDYGLNWDRGGLLSLEEACSRYTLTVEEFLAWQYSIDQHGLAGLRTTRIQQYRQ